MRGPQLLGQGACSCLRLSVEPLGHGSYFWGNTVSEEPCGPPSVKAPSCMKSPFLMGVVGGISGTTRGASGSPLSFHFTDEQTEPKRKQIGA